MTTTPSGGSLRMMEPLRVKRLTFRNRVLRSSLGGKFAYFDGSVNNPWKSFEKRFARSGVAGLISATITVDDRRWAPVEYPRLSHDRFVASYAAALADIKASAPDTVYIMQIGDGGSHVQNGLFSQPEDAKTSSAIFDLLYGYRSLGAAMTEAEIEQTITRFAEAARRVKEVGCDGVEVTASKGYLIHQFLNPGVNRRRDAWGGSTEKRFRLLREVATRVRERVGPDFLFGVRLSAVDYNHLPLNLRLPLTLPLRHWFTGNGLAETTWFARELEAIGVDYLHVTSGYGFINPMENPGDFPLKEVTVFANASRHLSAKARLRAMLLNVVPDFILRPLLGAGWRRSDGHNGRLAAEFKRAVKIPVVANGGFQSRALIERALAEGHCDMVSMARPLLANPDLLRVFETRDVPERPCSFCNRCAVLTAVQAVGCYDPRRFESQDAMEDAILRWSVDPDLERRWLDDPGARVGPPTAADG